MRPERHSPQVIEITEGMLRMPAGNQMVDYLLYTRRGSRFNTIRIVGGREGRGPPKDGSNRSHLPLRGKLGWMTPWFSPA